jgi:nitroreductase
MDTKENIHTTRSETLKSVITNRRSVRQFTSTVIDGKDLMTIVESGVHAPSGSNAQNQRFLILENTEEKNALGKIRFVWPYPSAEKMRQKKISGLIGGAAAVIVVFADTALSDRRNNGEYYIWESLEVQNCAASIENMLNMATALGIGSCWLSASPKMSRTRLLTGKSWATAFASFDVPPWYKIQGIVVLGYPSAGYDENGYPKGEKKHGASEWAPTARRPVAHYLINKKSPESADFHPLSGLQKFKLRILSVMTGRIVKLLHRLDRSIYKLEVQQALQAVYSQKTNDR